MKQITKPESTTNERRQNHSTTRYFEELKHFDLLTREDEIELAQRIRKGDSAATDRMVNSNLRLVAKIANAYSNCGMSIEDLISEGNIGLMKAAERFDPKFGTRFSTYAAWWIKQAIMRALGNQSRTIRLPLHLVQKIRELDRTSQKLAYELGREPTDDELAALEEMPTKEIVRIRQASQPVASLDNQTTDDGCEPCHLGAFIPDESAADPAMFAESEDMKANLTNALSTLAERERKIIISRFGLDGGDPQTLEDIGITFGVTRERIRQIQKKAVEKLRSALRLLDRAPTPKSRQIAARSRTRQAPRIALPA